MRIAIKFYFEAKLIDPSEPFPSAFITIFFPIVENLGPPLFPENKSYLYEWKEVQKVSLGYYAPILIPDVPENFITFVGQLLTKKFIGSSLFRSIGDLLRRS